MTGRAPAPRIRRAGFRDIRPVRALIDAAYGPHANPYRLPYQLSPLAYGWLVLGRDLWVLEDRGALAGSIMLRDNSIDLHVYFLAIRPDAQGRGHGRMLMDFAEAEARKRGLIGLRLHTPVVFTEAAAFYRRLGFEELARLTQGEHEFIFMMKRFGATAPRPAADAAPRPSGLPPRG